MDGGPSYHGIGSSARSSLCLVFLGLYIVRFVKVDAFAFDDKWTSSNLVEDAQDVFADEAHKK